MEIALIGNPNTGKTTLFNSLTNSYATVGNWTGVTVEKKMGQLKNATAKLIDLPGVYSLTPITRDEEVVTRYLLESDPDLILNVTNASQLKRNLLLTLEVRELGAPMILNLNMIDDLKRQGNAFDLATLSDQLGCPVMATNARNQDGIKELNAALRQKPHQVSPLQLDYPPNGKRGHSPGEPGIGGRLRVRSKRGAVDCHSIHQQESVHSSVRHLPKFNAAAFHALLL